MAARPLREAWRRVDLPPIEWWTGRVDVVHGPNFVVPPARHAAQIVSVHDLTVLRYPELCTSDTLQYPELIRRAVRRGAWVQTIDAFVDEIVAEFGAAPERVVGIPDAAIEVIAADPARGRRIAGGDRFVLGLGTIEPRKNFPVLVRAFDRLADSDPDIRLVIAGGEGWGTDALTRELARARHADRVVRTGFVNEPDRAALLRAATVFAYPSVYEGFGLPPLEAMSVGTPVVTSPVGGIPDTVGDAALLVDPHDAEALAAALRSVLDDPALAASLASRGQVNLRRFSWERTADEIASLYRRAAAAR